MSLIPFYKFGSLFASQKPTSPYAKQQTVEDFLLYAANRAAGAGKRARKSGNAFSQTDVAQMQADYLMTQNDRQYQEYLYNTYESPAAMVRQYNEAGLNPAMMYSGGQSFASPASSGAQSLGNGSQGTQEPTGLDILSAILGLVGQFGDVGGKLADVGSNVSLRRSQADLNKSQENYYNTQSEKVKTDTALNNIRIKYEDIRLSLENEKTRKQIDESLARCRKIASDINLNNSMIEVNGSKIALNHSLADEADSKAMLSQSQAFLANAEREKLERLLPYFEQYQAAEVRFKEAQTEESKARAKNALAEAGLKAIEEMKQQQLLDKGIADIIIDEKTQQVKQMKTQRVLNIIDCAVDNAARVTNTVMGVVTGLGGLQIGNRNAAAHEQAVAQGEQRLDWQYEDRQGYTGYDSSTWDYSYYSSDAGRRF